MGPARLVAVSELRLGRVGPCPLEAWQWDRVAVSVLFAFALPSGAVHSRPSPPRSLLTILCLREAGGGGGTIMECAREASVGTSKRLHGTSNSCHHTQAGAFFVIAIFPRPPDSPLAPVGLLRRRPALLKAPPVPLPRIQARRLAPRR
jgi:hypothetical protein